MKNYFLITLIVLLPISVLGQSIFEKYQNNKEVTSISISPKMFQLLGSMTFSSGDPEANELLEMIKGIRIFKALMTTTDSISEELDLWVKGEATDRGLDLMISMQESVTDLSLYIKEGEVDGELESLLMFSKGVSEATTKAQVGGNTIESVVLLIEGKIELDKIAKLINKMDLPGGNQLKMVGI